MFSLVILYLYLCSWIASAAVVTYTLTYGNKIWLCRTTFDLTVDFGRAGSPAAAVAKKCACFLTYNEGAGPFYFLVRPVPDPYAVYAIADLLGGANKQGHYGVEITVYQPELISGKDVQVPAFTPRVTLYFDSGGNFLGPCEYQANALQINPGDGGQPSRCPAGSTEIARVGRWSSCAIPCTRY